MSTPRNRKPLSAPARVFWVFAVPTLIGVAISAAIAWVARSACGVAVDRGWVVRVTSVVVGCCLALAARWMERLGWIEPRRRVIARRPDADEVSAEFGLDADDDDADDFDPVEVRIPWSAIRPFFRAMTMLAVMPLVGLFMVPDEIAWIPALILVALGGLITYFGIADRLGHDLVAWTDREGVGGRHLGIFLRRVAWDDLATCEWHLVRGIAYATLRDRRGRKVLCLSFYLTDPRDQLRFHDSIVRGLRQSPSRRPGPLGGPPPDLSNARTLG